jgi:hypothetical protein
MVEWAPQTWEQSRWLSGWWKGMSSYWVGYWVAACVEAVNALGYPLAVSGTTWMEARNFSRWRINPTDEWSSDKRKWRSLLPAL